MWKAIRLFLFAPLLGMSSLYPSRFALQHLSQNNLKIVVSYWFYYAFKWRVWCFFTQYDVGGDHRGPGLRKKFFKAKVSDKSYHKQEPTPQTRPPPQTKSKQIKTH